MKLKLLLGITLTLLVIGLLLPTAAMGQAKDTFKGKCAMCHGQDGSGNTPMAKSMGIKDLGGADVQKMSDADLTGAITNGKGKMPGYKDKLSGAQISDLVAYIRTLKH